MNAGGRLRGRRGAAERAEAFYRKVADQLIGQIERGSARWTQAWQPGEKAMPCKVVAGKAYRGGNLVWLPSVADQRGYGDERWGDLQAGQGPGRQGAPRRDGLCHPVLAVRHREADAR